MLDRCWSFEGQESDVTFWTQIFLGEDEKPSMVQNSKHIYHCFKKRIHVEENLFLKKTHVFVTVACLKTKYQTVQLYKYFGARIQVHSGKLTWLAGKWTRIEDVYVFHVGHSPLHRGNCLSLVPPGKIISWSWSFVISQ